MSLSALRERLAALSREQLPLPGQGGTAARHRRLLEVGREDLTLAKLAEAHWDAVAILAEAGRVAVPGQLYAVWAAELPGHTVSLSETAGGARLSGSKMFASGAGIVDRALVTVRGALLVEVDLKTHAGLIESDSSGWHTRAFEATQTGRVTFHSVPVQPNAVLGAPDWYVRRPGFWHGACGPAACWAGGAIGLFDYARQQSRADAHTLAHLGAMAAQTWALETCLAAAGEEIDREPFDLLAAQARALRVRHLVEQASTDMLRRFARGWGPFPLSMQADTARRYQELDLYLRQSHAERDLEALGTLVKQSG